MIQKCRACGKEVDITATTCPHCGAKSPTLTTEEYSAQTNTDHFFNSAQGILYVIIGLCFLIYGAWQLGNLIGNML